MRKTIRNRMAAGLLAGLTALGSAAPALAENLTDALTGAYRSAGLLDQNRALLRAADEDVAQAMSALRPILNYSASVGARRTGNGQVTDNSSSLTLGVSMDLLLYDYGASQYAIDAAKESVLATREALVSAEQQVLLRAVQAYMEVRRQSEIVGLRQSNLRLIQEELRAARDRFEVGEVTRTDVALAESRLAASQSALSAAQGSLAVAREEYRAAVGRMPSGLAVPPALPRTASSEDGAKAMARRSHPDIRRLQHEVAAAELTVMRAQAAMKPRLGLEADVSRSESLNSDSFTNSLSAGIGLSGPIYQGGQLSSLVRQAMARRDATRAQLHIVTQQVVQGVGNAWSQIRVARATREASEQQIRAARVAFRGVREEATLGARTTLDVLNAEQELLDAQAGLISAMVDEQNAAYALLSAMGLMTATHLNLPVQVYDPAAYYNLVKDAPTQRSSRGQQLDRVLKSLGKQ